MDVSFNNSETVISNVQVLASNDILLYIEGSTNDNWSIFTRITASQQIVWSKQVQYKVNHLALNLWTVNGYETIVWAGYDLSGNCGFAYMDEDTGEVIFSTTIDLFIPSTIT